MKNLHLQVIVVRVKNRPAAMESLTDDLLVSIEKIVQYLQLPVDKPAASEACSQQISQHTPLIERFERLEQRQRKNMVTALRQLGDIIDPQRSHETDSDRAEKTSFEDDFQQEQSADYLRLNRLE